MAENIAKRGGMEPQPSHNGEGFTGKCRPNTVEKENRNHPKFPKYIYTTDLTD